MKLISRLMLIAALVAGLVFPTTASAAITYSVNSLTGPYSIGGQTKEVHAYLNLTGTYATGGFTLTPADFGLHHIQSVMVEGEDGYEFYWDGANGKVLAYQTATLTPTGTVAAPTFTGTGPVAENIIITDDNSAADNGVQVYLDTDGIIAVLWFVSPTNADGTGTLANGGNGYFVEDDDDAAAAGTPLYFDEDAANADERFLAVGSLNADQFIRVAGGKFIRVKDDDSAASNGVAVYFDEDSTNSYERFLFVSPTNTDGVGSTDDVYFGLGSTPAGTNSAPTFTGVATTAAALGEVTAATSLANVDRINIVIKGW